MKIVLIGDDTISRWGPHCAPLAEELNRIFIRNTFHVENCGVAGSRAGHGIYRVSHDYRDESGALHPCIAQGNPDLVIVESFAYTNCNDDAEGLTDYREVLRNLWNEVERTTAAKMMFLVSLPPDRERFLENSDFFFNTPKATRQRMADRAKLYLEEAINIARDEEWPLADAYSETLKAVAKGDRLRRYINQSDCVTPSGYGYAMMARVLAREIDAHRMVTEKAET